MSKYLDLARTAPSTPKTDYELDESDELAQSPAGRPDGGVRSGYELDEPDELGPVRWPTVLDLLAERRQRGLVLGDRGPDGLVIVDPRGVLTPDFEAALRAREAELLGLLRDNARLATPVVPPALNGEHACRP